METSPLNPSLPGVRLLQHWIREKRPLSLDLIDQVRLEGRLVWQDSEFLALDSETHAELTLVNRNHVIIIRPLG
ncbi:MAG: Hfq-related RNA-binding protein [Synechococcus sp.]